MTSLKNSSVCRYFVKVNFFSKATVFTSRALLYDAQTFQWRWYNCFNASKLVRWGHGYAGGSGKDFGNGGKRTLAT
jgi:hypothetical protein